MSGRFKVDDDVRVPYDPAGGGITYGTVVECLRGDRYLVNVGNVFSDRYEAVFTGAQLKRAPKDQWLRQVEEER
jgi:hypothetical protein